MKIKMITCAVTSDLKVFDNKRVFEVEKEISKDLAESFLKANFAVVVDEVVKEKPAKKTLAKRGKKNEV